MRSIDTPRQCVPNCTVEYPCPRGHFCYANECIEDTLCPSVIPESQGSVIPRRKGKVGEVAQFICVGGGRLVPSKINVTEVKCTKHGWIATDGKNELMCLSGNCHFISICVP